MFQSGTFSLIAFLFASSVSISCVPKKIEANVKATSLQPVLDTDTNLTSCENALGEIPDIDCLKGEEIAL